MSTVTGDINFSDGIDYKENIKRLKIKSIQRHCIQKWKDYWAIRKEAEDWRLTSDLITVSRSSKFFSFQGKIKPRVSTESKGLHLAGGQIKHDTIYHLLPCHDLEEVGGESSAGKSKATMQQSALKAKTKKEVAITFRAVNK